MDTPPVVVVGAGLGGLTCVAELIAARRRVLVLEASDGVGGRVRTDRHPDGYLLDRGYQVLLDAYPGLRRHANIAAHDPRPFDSGAHVWTGSKPVPLADPFRHPSSVAPAYAPPGYHLLAASTVGAAALDGDEDALAHRLRLDAALLIGHDPADWTVLGTYCVPFAQFAQPSGIHGRRPMNRTGVPGLYLASEATVDSSQNSAILSGEAAARAVLTDLTKR